jgi:hypothetical protein
VTGKLLVYHTASVHTSAILGRERPRIAGCRPGVGKKRLRNGRAELRQPAVPLDTDDDRWGWFMISSILRRTVPAEDRRRGYGRFVPHRTVTSAGRRGSVSSP